VDAKKDSTSILIVDDEESLRLTFEMFLTREGYGPVRTAATYQEALAAIHEHEFDLIISDIVLEGTSGTDLLGEIRAANVQCPVVMITGFPNLQTAAEAVRLGAFDYIPKPVNKETLLKFTRQALKQWHLQKEKKRLEKENEHYRQYLDTIFRSVRDAIITVDNEMQVVHFNEMAKEWMGGMGLKSNTPISLEMLPEGMRNCCLKDAQKVLRTREEVREHRVECSRPDGGKKILSLNAAPLQDGSGGFQGVVFVARDVTSLEESSNRAKRSSFHRYVGSSPAMQSVYSLIENVGKVDTTVLITGESGTGKELAVEALHAESPRHNKPLVKVDCAAITDDLLESELFGHKKGSFTGADRDRMGRILQADGGTLFLDEIGDISSRMQLRLLRFLQERSFYPVGRDRPIQVDVRVVAATNADLRKKVLDGDFREDLFFRLRVMEIKLPPLRERYEGIPILVAHFLSQFQEKLGREISGISDQAMEALRNFGWPGNVRELEHVMERACILCEGSTLTLDHFPEEIRHGELAQSSIKEDSRSYPVERRHISDTAKKKIEVIEETVDDGLDEPQRILAALHKAGGNKAKAARILGMDRSTLYRKMHTYKIELNAVKV